MDKKVRRLQVPVACGSDHKKADKAQILLKGKWVKEAGFPPYSCVTVENPTPGVLIIKAS